MRESYLSFLRKLNPSLKIHRQRGKKIINSMNNNIDDTNPDQFKIPTNVNPSPRSSNLTSRVLADEYSSTITYNSYFFESNRPKDDPPRSNSSLPKITNSSLENPPRDHDRSDLVPISCRETGGGGRDRFLNHE